MEFARVVRGVIERDEEDVSAMSRREHPSLASGDAFAYRQFQFGR